MHREKCSFLPSRGYLRLDTFEDLEKVFIPSPLRCPMRNVWEYGDMEPAVTGYSVPVQL